MLPNFLKQCGDPVIITEQKFYNTASGQLEPYALVEFPLPSCLIRVHRKHNERLHRYAEFKDGPEVPVRIVIFATPREVVTVLLVFYQSRSAHRSESKSL